MSEEGLTPGTTATTSDRATALKTAVAHVLALYVRDQGHESTGIRVSVRRS